MERKTERRLQCGMHALLIADNEYDLEKQLQFQYHIKKI